MIRTWLWRPWLQKYYGEPGLTYAESDIYPHRVPRSPTNSMVRKRSSGERKALATREDKPLAWLSGEIKTPPLSGAARQEAGVLLRRLQRGEPLKLPESRPMPSIGPRCHELRIDDVLQKKEWRVVYYIGHHAIALLEVFQKTTRATPAHVVAACRRRAAEFRKVDES